MKLFFTIAFKRGPNKNVSIKISTHLLLKNEVQSENGLGNSTNRLLSVQDHVKRRLHRSRHNVSLDKRVGLVKSYLTIFQKISSGSKI
jgi:hypothetical protein